jgi:hypothetical protein
MAAMERWALFGVLLLVGTLFLANAQEIDPDAEQFDIDAAKVNYGKSLSVLSKWNGTILKNSKWRIIQVTRKVKNERIIPPFTHLKNKLIALAKII